MNVKIQCAARFSIGHGMVIPCHDFRIQITLSQVRSHSACIKSLWLSNRALALALAAPVSFAHG